MSKWSTKIWQATTTTEVRDSFPRFHDTQPIVRNLNATGNNASSKITFYVPKSEFKVGLAAALASDGVSAYLPVDVEAGHIINGHTLTTSDYLAIATSTGVDVREITGVSDDAGEDYCHATIAATGKTLLINTDVWVVRATDIIDLTVGNASIEKDFSWVAGNYACPLVVGATSGDATDTRVKVTVQYKAPSEPDAD